jgi:hypothetical protein
MLIAGSAVGVGESGTGHVVQPWEEVTSQAGPFVSGDKIESFEDLTLVPNTGSCDQNPKAGSTSPAFAFWALSFEQGSFEQAQVME